MKNLTGRTQYRISLFRKLILQVQVSRSEDKMVGPTFETSNWLEWQDATLEDLQCLDLIIGRSERTFKVERERE